MEGKFTFVKVRKRNIVVIKAEDGESLDGERICKP